MGNTNHSNAVCARSETAEILIIVALVLGIVAADVALLMTFLR